MESKRREEEAIAYMHARHNCAQAVLWAFRAELGKSEAELNALGAAFGSGMGGMEATCGALCGAGIALGILHKGETPAKFVMKEIVQGFKAEASATDCRDLKGIETKKVLCACDDCVHLAVRGLAQKL